MGTCWQPTRSTENACNPGSKVIAPQVYVTAVGRGHRVAISGRCFELRPKPLMAIFVTPELELPAFGTGTNVKCLGQEPVPAD